MGTVARLHTRLNSGRWPITGYAVTVLSLIITVLTAPGHAYSDVFVYQLFGSQMLTDPMGALNPVGGGEVQPYPLLLAPFQIALSFVPEAAATTVFLLALALPITALVVTVIHRTGRWGQVAAIWFAGLTVIMGGGYWLRLEPIIVVLFAAGLCAAVRRESGPAYLWILLATAAKLIPLAGFLAVPLRRPALNWKTIATGLLSLVVIADAARILWITMGRSIQVEAIPALPMLVARMLGSHDFSVTFIPVLPDLCVVVLGPAAWVTTLGWIGNIATIAGVAYATWLLWRAYGKVAGPGVNWKTRLTVGSTTIAPSAQIAAVLAVTSAILIGGRVFSPQYVAMLAVPAVVLYAVTASRSLLLTASLTTVLSFILYPYFYFLLATDSALPVVILLARAAALISLYFVAVRLIRVPAVAVSSAA